MKLCHEDQRGVSVINIKGDMTSDNADRFRRYALERLEADARDFVLEFGELETIDSLGLEALLWLQEQATERLGQIRLANCPDFLRDILRVTQLEPRLTCEQDSAAAIRSLG